MQSRSAKSLIYAVFRWWYIEGVHKDGPAPPGSSGTKLKVCVMSLMKNFDRIAPLYLLALGVFAAVSTAGLGA